MAITQAQADTATEFHAEMMYGRSVTPVTCTTPGFAANGKSLRARRNGRTQRWKRQPERFSIPVKFGMRARDQFRIDETEARHWHAAEDCPAAVR